MNRNPLRHALGSVVSVSFLAADGSEETVIGTLDEVSESFLAIIHGAIGDAPIDGGWHSRLSARGLLERLL